MTADYDDDNFSLLPGDISGRRRGRSGLDEFDFSEKGEKLSGRFDILQPATNKSVELARDTLGNKAARAAQEKGASVTAQPTTSTKISKAQIPEIKADAQQQAVTGENYQKAYLRRQRQAAIERAGVKDTTPEDAKRIAARKLEEEETMQRVRARDLATQIMVWKNELGGNNYEETYVNGMISDLERQLNGIDPKFWS